ncbi:MAG: MerR family transcriptional regulator, partial [Erysipelotrichaceae bacterium]
MKLSVKEITQNYGVSRRMLQRYEKLNLIHSTERNKYGHLYYDEEMIHRIIIIRFLQQTGFTLPQIKEMNELSTEEIKNLFKETYRQLNNKISNLDILKDKTEKIIK